MSRTGRCLLAALALAGPAWAEDAAEDHAHDEEGLPEPVQEPVAPAPVVLEEPAVRLFVGARFGAGFALEHLLPGPAPAIEAGVLLGRDHRFQPFVEVGYQEAHATGQADATAFPDGYTWTLALRTLSIAPGFRYRVLPWRERLSPELSAGPLLHVTSVAVGGEAGGAAFPETREVRAAGGGFLGAGLVGTLGPGQLHGQLQLSLVHHDGDLTGPVLLPTLTPSIGYRLIR